MCSRYWNLKATFVCPACGASAEDELQTHWLGDDGSCINHYRLGDKAYELRGIKLAVVDGSQDDFIGHCDQCGAWIDFGARIEDEAVVDVWPISIHRTDTAVSR
jgi:hypothetical protein